MENGAIGIFDSGVGGLTVLSEIKKALPNEDLIYLGDTLNFPYGSKKEEEIIKYGVENAKFLISKGVKMIVIACGTATSYALKELQNRFDIPIIRNNRAYNFVHKKIRFKSNSVLLQLVGTIKSASWEKAIKKEIPNIDVINKACPMLATVAEEGRAKSKEGKMAIKEYMRVFKEKKVQNIILGCTHYPIYIPIIKEELGYDVNLINTGETVAKYIKDNFIDDTNVVKYGTQQIFLTKPEDEFVNIAKSILGIDVEILNK